VAAPAGVLAGVLADLADECAELDALVAPLDDAGWQHPTPAAGWTIATQIGHLAWTDDIAVLSATDPDGFTAEVTKAIESGELDTYVDRAAAEWAARPELLATWRRGRSALTDALTALPPGAKLPWFGPPMSAPSMATARLMETWAHGQDVADALGAVRPATDRLKHVAHLGVRTRDFAFRTRGLEPPAEEFRVELVAPSGAVWTWGPAEAAQRVTGPALDFCLLVTQRRHPDDLALTAAGPDAERWLGIAQAFAGPPGPGRAPGQFGS
jgi:uncharacterized protein (TIGR03084 family)